MEDQNQEEPLETEVTVKEGSPNSGMSVEINQEGDDERTQETQIVRSPQPGSRSSDFERVR